MHNLTLVLILLGIIIFQQVFWMIHVQRMVNKLMSRTFGEYRRAEAEPKQQRQQVQQPQQENNGASQAEELNSMFSLG